MNGRFQAYEVALELTAALAPVLTSLGRRDSSLASQLRRAAASVPLCLAAGARRTGKDRLHLTFLRAGRGEPASRRLKNSLGRPARAARKTVSLPTPAPCLWNKVNEKISCS